MKRILKIVGIILAVIILIIAGMATYIHFASAKKYQSVEIPELTVDTSTTLVERGFKLVEAGCVNCHRSDEGILEGKWFEDIAAENDFGRIYTSNITKHPEAGIGNYTDGELYRLLRTGVKKDGSLTSTVMPKWNLCSDEDIHAIIAFLKSDHKMVAPSKKTHPTYKPTFLAKALNRFIFRPLPYAEKYPETPKMENNAAHGKYIVEATAMCYVCHSEDITAVNLEEPTKTPGYLDGGFSFMAKDYTVVAPSLLLDGQSNMSSWSEADFVKAVKFGVRPNDQPAYLFPMHPYPHLDSIEVQAIYSYLKDYSSGL